MSILSQFVKSESGATAIEYGLIASLIALVIITMLEAMGGSLTNVFAEIAGNLH